METCLVLLQRFEELAGEPLLVGAADRSPEVRLGELDRELHGLVAQRHARAMDLVADLSLGDRADPLALLRGALDEPRLFARGLDLGVGADPGDLRLDAREAGIETRGV